MDEAAKNRRRSELAAAKERIAELEAQLAEAQAQATKYLLFHDTFFSLFELTSAGVGLIQDHAIIYANDRLGQLLGRPPAEILGHHFTDFVVPEQREWLAGLYAAHLGGNNEIDWTTAALLNSDGSPVDVELEAAVIRYDGKPTEVVLVRDIRRRIRAERLLRDSEERFRIAASIAGDLIFEWTLEDNQVRWFSDIDRLLGYEPGGFPREVAAMNQQIHPDDRERFYQAAMESIRTGNPFREEYRLRKKNGEYIYVSSRGIVVHDRDGWPIKWIGVNTDITEQRTAADSLAESQRYLANIIDFLPDATLVINHEGRVIAWNRAMEEMTSVPAKDMLGKGNYEYALPFYGERRPILVDMVMQRHPEFEARYSAIVRKDETIWGEAYTPFLGGGKMYLSATAAVLRDSKGNVAGAIESIRDNTERQQAQEALRASEEKFRALAEGSADVIMRFDTDFRHVYVNPAVEAQTGIPPADFIGKTHAELGFPPHLVEIFETALHKTVETRSPNRVEFELPKHIWIDWVLTPEFGPDGKVQGVMTAARDITNLKNIEKALQDSLDLLEMRVAERTAELRALNESMQIEIAERKRAEESLRRSEERFRFMSFHDAMTGLFNRTYFDDKMKEIDQQLATLSPLAIMVMDVDGLKIVNDTLGHSAGDALLNAAARAIGRSFSDGAILCRVGGDEFCALLPGVGWDEAAAKRDQILENVHSIQGESEGPRLSLSIGVACSLGHERETAYDVYQRADEDMYHYKMMQIGSPKSRLIDALLTALSQRDYVAQGHVERLARIARMMADRLRLPENRKKDLLLLARMHDLGKMGVPDHILFKPAALDDAEFDAIKKHAHIGHKIATRSRELSHIAALILHHHEWWDGSGYPSHLRAEAIPLECRILHIADAFDAMTNPRPYRGPLTGREAIAELTRKAGTQFDPHLVECFIELYDQGFFRVTPTPDKNQ